RLGHLVEDKGALCLFLDGYLTKEGTPLPLIVRKSDGGYGYATTDLAAIRYRLEVLQATRVIYVVGAPQTQHLAMIRDAAKKIGWLKAPARAEHVAFGSVLGQDRKIFRARSGESVKLAALITEAIERAEKTARERLKSLDEETIVANAHPVGVGAL